MRIIVAVDRNFGIGKDNMIPWHISRDLKRFKECTMGKTIVMGYNTLLSLPGSKALKGRNNIVLNPDDVKIPDCTVVHSKEELLETVKDLPGDQVYITGGASIYRLFVNDCDRIELTVVEGDYECDTFFPDLREMPEWKKVCESETFEEDGVRFHYEDYVKE